MKADEKKHMVILCGSYYPTPSATGVCADIYAQLFLDNYDIDVICGTSCGSLDSYMHNNKSVHPIGTCYVRIQKWMAQKHVKLLLQLSKIPAHILGHFRHPNVLYWYISSAYKELVKINRNRPIDVIMSFGAPIASHAAAAKFKGCFPYVKWIALSFDSYGAQNSNNEACCNFEKRLLDKADHVFVSEEIYKNCGHLINDGSTKYTPLPYLVVPHIKRDFKSNIKFTNGSINFVYAGSFYRELRNPRFLLSLFMELPSSYILHLFCTSNCDDIINHYVKISKGRIIRHPVISQQEVLDVYSMADVLINVGNNSSQFKPSKTFEYMSTLKPIINIYYKGFYDESLAQYPKCLQICNDSEVDTSASDIIRFVDENKGTQVQLEQLNILLGKHGPDNIAKILNSAIYDVL